MNDPATSPEYDAFKALLGRVLTVPRSVIQEREARYKRESELNPNRRGPKSKKAKLGRRAPGASPQA